MKSEIAELKEEEEYYSQEYSVNSKTASQEYYILTTSILPEGVYVANMEGKNVDTLKMGEHLKIMIPKEKLQEDLSIRVDIEAQCEAYLIYEGKTTVENTQNYVVTAGDKIYVEENIKLDLKAKKYGNIKIIKTDKENEEIKLEGIKFELYNEEKNRIGVYSTNANGEIYIEGLPIGKYTIKEIETNKWYNSQTKDLEVEVENKETSEVIVTNELKKGQIKIIKVDKDDKKTKLEGIKFEVQDKEGNILETLITDKNGEAITKKYAIKEYENLYIKEIETDTKYVFNDEIKEIKLEANQIKELVFENEKVKGQIKIVKTSKDENKMNGKKAGTPLEGVKFQIYSKNNKLLETLTTDKNGIAMSKELEKGEYIIKEIETNKYYFLNKKTFNAIIENNKQIVEVDITNESKNPDIDIEKNGSEIANIGENVEYDISFRNTGNTALDNFTMVDYIPYEYIDVTNFKTGTYNQDISYNLYYKSNLTDEYVLLMEDLRSKVNYEINLTEELASNEYITEIKMEFGTVDIGFSTNENPHITGLVREKVKSEEVFTNIADISAKYDNYNVYDKSKWKTTAYKFLPKTGF